jgi:hypothetical protein
MYLAPLIKNSGKILVVCMPVVSASEDLRQEDHLSLGVETILGNVVRLHFLEII